MSNAKIIDFGAAPDLMSLEFPDLENHLEKRLEAIKTLPDLEKLIGMVNPLLRVDRFNQTEQGALKRLRQRAYDRKRNPKFQNSKSKTVPNLELQISKAPFPNQKVIPNETPRPPRSQQLERTENMAALATPPTQNTDSFWERAQRALRNINGEMFVKTAPKLAVWFSAASLVSFFLWHQSLALYESAGFTNSFYAATGGLLMITGFAAYHSITRSWLALLFCLYAGAYEGYLMVSGTIHNDNQIQADAVQSNPELIFLQEKADKERERYHELKQRYDNPESKVFHNEWFSKTHLNPAWEASAKAHEDFIAKKAALMAASSVEHVTWIKIFYRLGLVFLCMMLVHRFFCSLRK